MNLIQLKIVLKTKYSQASLPEFNFPVIQKVYITPLRNLFIKFFKPYFPPLQGSMPETKTNTVNK